MDNSEGFALEFLDLTDVEDQERNHVLAVLQPCQKNLRLPWFIGEDKRITSHNSNLVEHRSNKPTTKQTTQPINNLISIPNNIATGIPINAVNGLPINTQYYPHPQYYSSSSIITTLPNVPVPATYNNYPPSNSHTPIFPTYMALRKNLTPKTIFYQVPPGPHIFVSDPSTNNAYQNPAFFVDDTVPMEPPVHEQQQWNSQTLSTQNLPVKKSAVSPLSADTPAFTPKSQQQNLQKDDSDTKENAEKSAPPLENQTEEVKKPELTEGTIGAISEPPKQNTKKSWASLFDSKPNSTITEVNGIVKNTFPEETIKESNNDHISPIKNPKRSHFIDPDCYRMGEFLKNYTIEGRTISLQPRGLINQSNYCYINSILQALLACPPMYNLLSGLSEKISSNEKRKPTPVIDGMCKFVKEYKHLPANMRINNRRSDGGKKDQKRDLSGMINTDIPFEPSWIYKILNGLQTDLIEGRQEDAEEFLGCLLNKLSDEMIELIKLIDSSEKTKQEQEEEDESWQVMGTKNKGSVLRRTEFERTPITDIFGGSLKSKINRTGGLITENTQPFFTLPLNIEKVKTVREALEALTTKNQLEGLTSSKTNEEVEAWQQVMLDDLPIVLVLHLKCFDFKLDGCTKIMKALEFPIDLKIDGKLISSKTANAKEKQYKLFAVVYHDGKEATKGHYVTDAFHVGYSNWLRYDDASVKPVQEEQVLNPQGTRVPYLLFYRRSDTIRSR
ncbi:hypothetical protein ABEB36_000620 [Hypothenemus hampei]|uniref:ubiquitinyl hydrolase 1 n=1 Tax=Hypothenemus hampei TaxID=57062 RepID=A0ABD1FEI0_HYPHA